MRLRFHNGTVQVKNVADDHEVAYFQAKGDREIYVFGFSPDGRFLATTEFSGLRPHGLGHQPAAPVVLDDPGPVYLVFRQVQP